MNLYLVHCGYYDSEICDGLYEGHVNYFVTAENFEAARGKVKDLTEFKNKKMHIDGLQEIQQVGGYKILLELNPNNDTNTKIINYKQRELAPKVQDN